MTMKKGARCIETLKLELCHAKGAMISAWRQLPGKAAKPVPTAFDDPLPLPALDSRSIG